MTIMRIRSIYIDASPTKPYGSENFVGTSPCARRRLTGLGSIRPIFNPCLKIIQSLTDVSVILMEWHNGLLHVFAEGSELFRANAHLGSVNGHKVRQTVLHVVLLHKGHVCFPIILHGVKGFSSGFPLWLHLLGLHEQVIFECFRVIDHKVPYYHMVWLCQ